MEKARRVCALVVLAAGVVRCTGEAGAQRASLRVLASNGVKAVVEDLLPEIERNVGLRLDLTFGTSASIERLAAAGESFEAALLTAEAIDGLIDSGKLAAGSRISLGRSGIGIGVRAGRAKPGIDTPESLKRTLLRAKSLTYASDGASRVYITRMLETLGIADEVAQKTELEQGSVRATSRVARGEAELVLTLVSEIIPVQGIELVGPIPLEFQHYIDFAAAIGVRAPHAEGARALLTFLSSPDAVRVFAARGVSQP